jgi:hypothetical protein
MLAGIICEHVDEVDSCENSDKNGNRSLTRWPVTAADTA